MSKAEETVDSARDPGGRVASTGAKVVGSVMTRDVEAVEPTSSLREVYDIFAQRDIHHLPVVEGERLVGLISSNDLLRRGIDAADAKGDAGLSAQDIMRGHLIVAREDSTLREAAAMLSGGAFHALPVVDPNQRLLGIVTSTDLLRLLAESLD